MFRRVERASVLPQLYHIKSGAGRLDGTDCEAVSRSSHQGFHSSSRWTRAQVKI